MAAIQAHRISGMKCPILCLCHASVLTYRRSWKIQSSSSCLIVPGSNVVSVAEHVVMQILALVRNYIPAYTQVQLRC